MPAQDERLRPKVALATCAAYPELDIDDQLLIDPLRALGVDTTIAIWDEPSIAWEQYDLVLIRSTWDYTQHHSAFLSWAEQVQERTQLANPLPVLSWSSQKTYLRDLERSGVPIVPTEFIAPGQSWRYPDGEFVIKPTISAGSRDTFRFSASRTAEGDQAIAAMHARGQVAMIQPYFASVDVRAETAMIFIAGEFSHAVSKAALLTVDQSTQIFERGLFLREKIAARTPRPEQLAVARAALSCAPDGWLYARVDVIDDADDSPVVLELEMVEPSLFLGFHGHGQPAPAETLAGVIASQLATAER